MTRIALVGEISQQVRGVTYSKDEASDHPAPGLLPILRAGNIQDGQLDLNDLVYVPASRVREAQRIRAHDVVIAASSGSLDVVGKAAMSRADLEGGFGAFLKVLRPGDDVDPHYFAQYFQTKGYRRRVSALAAGANINNLKNEHLNELPVPLPPLVEQRRLAEILDRASALRAKRRRLLEKLESLAQALFDEARKTSTVCDTALGDIARFAGGASLPPGEPFVGQTGGALLMKVSDMNAPGNERTVLKTALWTDRAVPASSTVEAGAVVLPKRGASIATNKKRVVTRRTTLDPNLMGVTPIGEQLTSDYLFAWLGAFDLTSITSGSSVPQLNKQDLTPLLFPLPSRAEQLTFSARISRVELARTRGQQSLAIADELFASLQHRAFRGEL